MELGSWRSRGGRRSRQTICPLLPNSRYVSELCRIGQKQKIMQRHFDKRQIPTPQTQNPMKRRGRRSKSCIIVESERMKSFVLPQTSARRAKRELKRKVQKSIYGWEGSWDQMEITEGRSWWWCWCYLFGALSYQNSQLQSKFNHYIVFIYDYIN